MDKPFEMLACFIQTLACRQKINLPYVAGARNTEWAESFFFGFHHSHPEESVIHANSSRRNGKVANYQDQLCDWSLGEILRLLQEWSSEDLAAANLQPFDGTLSAHLQAIANLDNITEEDGPHICLAGLAWTVGKQDDLVTLTTFSLGLEEKWTLDDVVSAVAKNISAKKI